MTEKRRGGRRKSEEVSLVLLVYRIDLFDCSLLFHLEQSIHNFCARFFFVTKYDFESIFIHCFSFDVSRPSLGASDLTILNL